MKILVQGRKAKKYRRFECEVCGCVFLADRNEYKFEGRYFINDTCLDNYSCSCPNCGDIVYSNAGDEIVEE